MTSPSSDVLVRQLHEYLCPIEHQCGGGTVEDECVSCAAASRIEELEKDEHPSYCGGTYEGLGFMDPQQTIFRARCVNHGRRLVQGPRGGPFKYVSDDVVRAEKLAEQVRALGGEPCV